MCQTDDHRVFFAARLRAVAAELQQMLSYWQNNDLPGDYLTAAEYPFRQSLDDLAAEVDHAAEVVEARSVTTLPDFDTVESVGLDATLRSLDTGNPYTWEDVAKAAMVQRNLLETVVQGLNDERADLRDNVARLWSVLSAGEDES